jgi:uncharacterized protein (DUF58 family)
MQGTLESVDQLNPRQYYLAVKKLADTLSYGTDRSPFLGSGIEYVQSRAYQPGDPIRAMDWRVTARTGKHHVKDYEAPKRLSCYLLIDTSASMMVSNWKRTKYAVAVHLAGALALACLERVSPVGVVGLGGKELQIKPSLSRQNILQWMHLLRTFRFDEPTLLGQRITDLAPTLRERAILFVLSDLHDDEGLPALRLLAQKHEVVVLQLRDPAERGVEGAGFLRASEAESGKSFVTRSGKAWVDGEAMGRNLRRAGVDHLLIDIDEPFEAHLRHFLQSRNLLGRAR